MVDKPFPQDGALRRQLRGPRKKRQRWQTSPAGLSLPPEQKTGKAGAYKAVLVADGGCWHCLRAPASRCRPPRWWLRRCVCVGEREVSAAACCLLLLLAGLCWCWCSCRCLSVGRKKMDQSSTEEWCPGPDQLRTGDRCCEIHSETVLDCEMQPLGLLLLLIRDVSEATSSTTQRKTKEGFCLPLSHLPCENKREMQEASA